MKSVVETVYERGLGSCVGCEGEGDVNEKCSGDSLWTWKRQLPK